MYYNKLFDCYSSLFTKSQQEYFTSYFHHDLSLSEISDNMNVSRAGISKQLKAIKEALDIYEEKLGLSKIYDSIDYINENIETLNKDDVKSILSRIGGEL